MESSQFEQEQREFLGLKLPPISEHHILEEGNLTIDSGSIQVASIDNHINPLENEGSARQPTIKKIDPDESQSETPKSNSKSKMKRKHESKKQDKSKRSKKNYYPDALSEPNLTMTTATECAHFIIRTIKNDTGDQSNSSISELIKTIETNIKTDDKRQIRKSIFKLKDLIVKTPDEVPGKESLAALIAMLHAKDHTGMCMTLLKDRNLQFLGKIYRRETQQTNIDELVLAEGTNAIMPLMFELLSIKAKFQKLQEFDAKRINLHRVVARFDRSMADTLSQVVQEEPNLLFELKQEPFVERINFDLFFHIIYEFLGNRSISKLVTYLENLQKNSNIAITDITTNWKSYNNVHINTIKNYRNVVQISGILEIYPEIATFLNKLNE